MMIVSIGGVLGIEHRFRRSTVLTRYHIEHGMQHEHIGQSLGLLNLVLPRGNLASDMFFKYSTRILRRKKERERDTR